MPAQPCLTITKHVCLTNRLVRLQTIQHRCLVIIVSIPNTDYPLPFNGLVCLFVCLFVCRSHSLTFCDVTPTFKLKYFFCCGLFDFVFGC